MSHLFVGSEDLLQGLSAESLKLLVDNGVKPPATSRFPLFESLYTKDPIFEPLPPLEAQWHDKAVYLHSSGMVVRYPMQSTTDRTWYLGSTAFPKPLSYTHEQLMLVGLCPCNITPAISCLGTVLKILQVLESVI